MQLENCDIFYIAPYTPEEVNRTRYARLRYLCHRANVHILTRQYVSADLVQKAVSHRRFTKPVPKFFLALWYAVRIVCHNSSGRKKICYTTYVPVFFLTGWIVRLFGVIWIADIWDDPRKSIMVHLSVADKPGMFWRFSKYTETVFCGKLLRSADIAVTLIAPELKAKYKIPDKKIIQTINGVHLNIAYPDIPEKSDGGFIFLYVGPIAHFKLSTLPDACRIIGDRIGDFKIQFAGPIRPGEGNRLKNVFKLTAPQVDIEISGRLPHDVILKKIALADVCLCPYPDSLDLNPAFPVKIFEYMALGKPILATALRGTLQVLTHKRNALIVPPGEPGSMASAMVDLYRDEGLRRRIAAQARKDCIRYDWARIHKRLFDEIEQRLK